MFKAKSFMWIALFLLLVILGLFIAVSWYFSNALISVAPYTLQPEFKILEVLPNTANLSQVTLPEPPNKNQFANTRREGTYNLLWETGYGRLGKILGGSSGRVVRELALTSGELPKAGDDARLESFVFRNDPKIDFDIDYQEVRLVSDAGRLQAWWIDQNSETAVLMLHGRRRGNIQETLRALPVVVDSGYSVLTVAYRNHAQSAPSPDGFYHYGDSEWQDAVEGLKFLAQQGVKRVILYGFSMGGAVALETFERYKDEPTVIAIILDSPLLDPYEVFLYGAKLEGLPLPNLLTRGAMAVAKLRTGINWSALDHRKTAQDIKVPVLLFGATADTTIPIRLVDEYASLLPDVEYHRLEGVEHVEPWNSDPQQYEAWVETFLEKTK
jgi:uncharacterized protein